MKLDSDASYVQNGPSLLLDPTPCFLLQITIKYSRSMMMEIRTLFDSSAFVCFIDKELMRQHKMILVKKKHTSSRGGHQWLKSFFRTCDT